MQPLFKDELLTKAQPMIRFVDLAYCQQGAQQHCLEHCQTGALFGLFKTKRMFKTAQQNAHLVGHLFVISLSVYKLADIMKDV